MKQNVITTKNDNGEWIQVCERCRAEVKETWVYCRNCGLQIE
jgi:ribosomal protein L40E